MSNARLIEKNIFVGVDIDAAGVSEVITLDRADRLSCQAIYTVDTPVNATVAFQGSNDGENWTDLDTPTAISANGTTFFEQSNVSFRYFRVEKALDSGDVDLECLLLVLGDAE